MPPTPSDEGPKYPWSKFCDALLWILARVALYWLTGRGAHL